MELFRLFGEIAIDGTRANRTLDDVSRKAGTTSKEVEINFKRIGTAASGIMRGMGIVGTAIGGAMLAVTEGTREYRAQMGLLDGAFQAAGHSSTEAKNTYSDLNAVLGDTEQAVEAAQHIALIADNEKEMNELTVIGTGVFATFGQSLPLEGLFEAVNHTASLGEVQGSLADALEWSGITVEEFNEKLEKCTNEEQRQDLIMKTLKDTYNEASLQYQETNEDVMAAHQAQERLADAMAELGRVGEPILTNIKNWIAEMVTAAVPHLENLIQKVQDVKAWVQDNEQTIMNWAAAIAGASVSIGLFLLVLNWGKIMGAAKTAIMGVRTAVLLFNGALRANPIGFVVSLLAGLVTAFIVLWNENEAFRNFWLDMWEKIKNGSANAVDWIEDKLDSLGEMASNVGKWFGDIYESISENINDAWEAVEEAVDKITDLFPLDIGEIFDNIKIPKITVSGGEAPYGIAGYGKLPSFNVKWNAEGAIFTKPTIFNTHNGLQGVGESGAEAVMPVTKMMDYVSTAVRNETGNIGRIIIEQNRMMLEFLRQNMPNMVQLDSGAMVGALLPAVDAGLADRWLHVRRGNVR